MPQKRKSDDQLIRFVWSRKIEYDYFLLVEVLARNPFSFKKPTPVWEDVAKALRESELKMNVNPRNCRERVKELLKKYRKEEDIIIRSTGATKDKLTELKKLLTSVNEMALAKPDDTQSSVYQKKKKEKGEVIRDAVLDEVSDTDSDDYIHTNSSKKKSRTTSRHSDSRDSDDSEVVGMNGYFNDKPMSLEEEHLMELELGREKSASDDSWKDASSSSRDNRHSIQLQETQSIDADDSDADDQHLNQGNGNISAAMVSIVPLQSVVRSTASLSEIPSTTAASLSEIPSTTASYSVLPTRTASYTVLPSSSNSRFSNPKKDLIMYLERKSEKDLHFRRDEIRLREMEIEKKREELQILRLKTEAEVEEKKRSQEQQARDRKEELEILRLKTEADVEDKKKIQDLLISLITQKNN